MFVVFDALFNVAVRVPLPFEETVPAAALKLAVVEFAATVTVAGTVRTPLFDESATVVPPAGAALPSVTVQEIVELDARTDAPHCSNERVTGTCRVSDAEEEELFSDAVTVAV
jgi:hypothetical protein